MGELPKLGRLERVPIREVWPTEPDFFTPWLAEPENLAGLADSLALRSLEMVGTEVAIGNFYLDILAKSDDGTLVVIENQFGQTDHTHLGQLMTYLAGQEGRAIVVWIAEMFREEHRAVVDWLNTCTVDGFNFFAVEVEAVRIAGSIPAPRFSVVAKPNTWSRGLTQTTRAATEMPRSDRQKVCVEYWTAFSELLAERGSDIHLRSVPRDSWCGFDLGRSGFMFGATLSIPDRYLRVEIMPAGETAKRAFDLLVGERSAIETAFGGPLNWDRGIDVKAWRISVSRGVEPTDRAQWSEQHQWLIEQIDRFTRAFRDRIRSLELGPRTIVADKLTAPALPIPTTASAS